MDMDGKFHIHVNADGRITPYSQISLLLMCIALIAIVTGHPSVCPAVRHMLRQNNICWK